jgi:aminomethyltransferase
MTHYLKTHLYDFHANSCAKIAPFAGYEMPIQYPTGVLKEHNWVRENAGIFDVSHMGQFILSGKNVAEFLSYITPTSFIKTPISKCKYTVLTNPKGGIIDDLIATRLSEDSFYLVLNAARKTEDVKWITENLPDTSTLTELNKSLIAVQGPKAMSILQKYTTAPIQDMGYMTSMETELNGMDVTLTRSGYTGEDGFEISLTHEDAQTLWQALLEEPDILPIGLAARDSLRLEAGLALYGHDLDMTTSPIEANLAWIVKSTGFIGAERIMREKEQGTEKYRVGIELQEKGIAREGTKIFNAEDEEIGTLTSGTFSPTLKKAIGQGYIQAEYAKIGTPVYLKIRDKKISALTHGLSFIKSHTHSTKKGTKAS